MLNVITTTLFIGQLFGSGDTIEDPVIGQEPIKAAAIEITQEIPQGTMMSFECEKPVLGGTGAFRITNNRSDDLLVMLFAGQSFRPYNPAEPWNLVLVRPDLAAIGIVRVQKQRVLRLEYEVPSELELVPGLPLMYVQALGAYAETRTLVASSPWMCVFGH